LAVPTVRRRARYPEEREKEKGGGGKEESREGKKERTFLSVSWRKLVGSQPSSRLNKRITREKDGGEKKKKRVFVRGGRRLLTPGNSFPPLARISLLLWKKKERPLCDEGKKRKVVKSA